MISQKARFARRLLEWYDRHRRDLPWRPPRAAAADDAGTTLDPYHVLVSEAMLQQTQVATVVPYYRAFLARFPTVHSLAAADEQAVLRLWQGLGYYSRARNLHRAAKTIVAEHSGKIPSDLHALQQLPGVGRYTAGAVASIAFGERAPILDGNVARVLCRLDRIEADPRQPATAEQLWRRAEEILPGRAEASKRCPAGSRRYGDFNSALMELGATVCTPRGPRCLICPVRDHCLAFSAGVQERIPPPRGRRELPLLERWTVCIQRASNGAAGEPAWLIEQRPAAGRWAGLWQFVTLEPTGPRPTRRSIEQSTRLRCLTPPKHLGVVHHGLTHRRYRFDVFTCRTSDGHLATATNRQPRAWARLSDLPQYPLPRPHLKIAGMLSEMVRESQ